MDEKFMLVAIKEANLGVKSNHGGPFGAVIVRNGRVISKAHNTVITENDCTAHAEINAIRAASKKLKRFDLSDCEIYSSCEPCPMCFSAIHWAKIKKLYFGANRTDAAKIDFDDKFIYDVIKGTSRKKQVTVKKFMRKECLESFKIWSDKVDRKQY